MKKPVILGVTAIVVLAIVLGVYTNSKKSTTVTPQEAKNRAEAYVNQKLLSDGSTVTLSEATEENGLYKVKVNIGQGQEVDSYISKDGKLFFPQGFDMIATSTDKATDSAANQPEAAPTPQNITKSDKPVVELFVMSYCPYGTQAEKGILPAIAALGDKVDFAIKFNDYAMHGEKELDENLIQYCIQKEQPSRFSAYLSCFLKDSSSAPCLDSTGVDKNALNSCVAKTDESFKVKANFVSKTGYRGQFPGFDVQKTDNAKYSVGGSPTLIINGAEVSSARDSASLLKTICSAFNNEPSECSTSLSSAAPAPGFGTGTDSGSGAAAGCAQ